MNNKIIYHDNCPDGFASAYIAWTYFGDTSNTVYIPMKFGAWKEDAVSEGDTVYIFDINFTPKQLLNWYDKAESIMLFDHHESHAYELQKMPFPTVLDFDECGASLAYNFFNPGMSYPSLIDYVKDRDLWDWKLYESKFVNAYINSFPHNFHIWEELEYNIEYNLNVVLREGRAILRSENQLVETVAQAASLDRFIGFEIPCVNSHVLLSEIGNRLLELYPEAPFAAVYYLLSNGRRKYSLRSRKDGYNVAALAKEYGGGGHHSAAGLII